MEQSVVDFVRSRLERQRGQWKRISSESGVPYTTIKNLMQGQTKDPRTSTVERLKNYFRREAA